MAPYPIFEWSYEKGRKTSGDPEYFVPD